MKIVTSHMDQKEVRFDNGIWFYWQSEGCFEIGEMGMDSQDLIHIHSNELEDFLVFLTWFVAKQSNGKYQIQVHTKIK